MLQNAKQRIQFNQHCSKSELIVRQQSFELVNQTSTCDLKQLRSRPFSEIRWKPQKWKQLVSNLFFRVKHFMTYSVALTPKPICCYELIFSFAIDLSQSKISTTKTDLGSELLLLMRHRGWRWWHPRRGPGSIQSLYHLNFSLMEKPLHIEAECRNAKHVHALSLT